MRWIYDGEGEDYLGESMEAIEFRDLRGHA